jgi:hypothetical protein
MTIPTHTITPSEPRTETTSKVEKDDKVQPSRMRGLLRRLTGRSKAQKADNQQYPPRTLEQVMAQYASDDLPEPENKEAAR